MANIVVTESCNLTCPYCFANEFVNKTNREISVDNFSCAIDFLTSSQNTKGFVGIIGGEPTLHSQYVKLLHVLIERDDVKDVTIFTNGIRIDETFEMYTEKFSFLVNLNSPRIIGTTNYSRTLRNLDRLLLKFGKHSFTLGINIYETNQDYQYFLDALDQYRLDNARLSITVSNKLHGAETIDRLRAFKHIGYELYKELLYRKIRPIFDCNKFPMCLWTEQEKVKIGLFQKNIKNEKVGINLSSCKCNPVIDILPDLTAIRCFGLSEKSKVPIGQFESYDKLKKYFHDNIDKPLSKIPTADQCQDCEFFISGNCYSGCLGNKVVEK